MFRSVRNVLIFGSLLLFFACEQNHNSSRSVSAENEITSLRNYDEKNRSNDNSIFSQDPGIKKFFVTPEIAYIHATIYARGNSYQETARFVQTNSKKIVDSLNQVSNCSSKILDYNHPVKRSGGKIMSGDEIYSSSSVSQIIIDFTETQDIQERISRVNTCLTSIPEIKLQNPQKKNNSISLRLSETVPTVRNMGAFRQQILASKFANLKEVAQATNIPPQFKPEETKCTSNGQVKIHERSLSRIELDIDFKCQQFN